MFAVTEQLKVKSFDELAALAKAKPKTLNYMSASLTKVAFVEEFNRKHGIDLVRVPFKGGGDAVNSMMTGTTQIAIFGIGNLIQFIRAGKIGGLRGRRRQALAARSRDPDVPRNRLHQTSRADLLRRLCADRHAEADHRQVPGRASPRSRPTPNSRSATWNSRALTAVLNTPEEFAKDLAQERVDGLDAIKASGLYPDVK